MVLLHTKDVVHTMTPKNKIGFLSKMKPTNEFVCWRVNDLHTDCRKWADRRQTDGRQMVESLFLFCTIRLGRQDSSPVQLANAHFLK
jgi:hypothetical protein